jgi:iron complex outermembrane receptor protein
MRGSRASSEAERTKLEEIIVTARRREESINSVPVAITALSGDDLRRKNVETAQDLQNYIPSLSVSSTGPTRDDYTFAIRGMGPTGGSGPGAVLGGGGTGVVAYFAEVPTSAAGPGLFYDLENVQVAEGPQGTLFGKNTTGGVILFVPRKPINDFEGFVEAAGGNYSMKGSTVQQRDGFTVDRGPFYPDKDYDNRNFWAARLSVVFRPTANLENYTIFSALRSNEHGDGFVLSAVNPAGAFASALLPIFAQQQAAGIRSTSLSDNEIDKRYNYGVFNTTRWSLNDDIQFKNIFSYQVQKWRNGEDIDGSPLVLDDLIAPGTNGTWHTQVGTYTEEPQFQGTALTGNLKWTAGAYYEDGRNIAAQPYKVAVAEGNFVIQQPNQTNSERSRGLYGQTTYDLGALSDSLQRLKLTTGYRYTWDNFGYGIEAYSPSLGNACLTSPGTYPRADCSFSSAGTSSGSSWTVGLDYQLAATTLLYIRSSRGYVTGGFNPSFGFTPGGVNTPQFRFAPESAVDAEVGVKSEFTVGTMPAQITADIFRSDFTNIQRLVSETLPGGVQSNFTANASKAEIDGFEFQGSIIPVKGLRISAAYSYNHGKYTKIDPAAAPSLVGVPFAYLPVDKASATAVYTLPFGATSGEFNIAATYSYQSRFFDAPAVQPLDYISAYGLLNLRLEWNDIMRSPFDASVFVSNATNKVYRAGQYSNYFSNGYITSFYGEPRMFGVQLRYRFGSRK